MHQVATHAHAIDQGIFQGDVGIETACYEPIRITHFALQMLDAAALGRGCAVRRPGMDVDLNLVAPEWCLSDELWEVIQLLLPEHRNTHRFGGGRPRTDDRVCMNAILFVLRTGCQWKALNATIFCPGSTAHDRFQEWVEAGVFLSMWEAGLFGYDEMHGIDWSWLSMDGCMTKAPLGGEKNRQESHRPGQKRRQAQPVSRRQRHPHRPGRRGGQPP
jgi:transposase